jgi:uncharacterized protein (DUF58 family)
MITARGWWFFVLLLALVALGAFDEHGWTLTVVALSLLLWFLWEWLLFTLRVRLAVSALECRRELWDEHGPVDTLWAGRTFQVRARLHLAHWLNLPHVRFADYVPFGVVRTRGSAENAGGVRSGQAVELDYSIFCPTAGRVRFEGVSVQLVDLQGFFYHATFLPGVAHYRVLPALADAAGNRPTVKRHNLLPSPGLHRHLRPGSGSELLDLRDYLPGDPPKTIAWKVSARRDRLITKEFESEVPVRCTLFVDTSHSVRVGPPGQNALARLVDISAAVAQATAGARDLTGLCLFDETRTTSYTRPARGSRHLIQLLHILADAAGLAPATGAAGLAALLPAAHAFVQKVYPYLLRHEINRVPSWLPWLWPVPATAGRPTSMWARAIRLLSVSLALVPLVAFGVLLLLAGDLVIALSLLVASVLLPVPEPMLVGIGVSLVAIGVTCYYALVQRLHQALALSLSPRRRRQARWGKHLAAILSEHYGLAPGGLGILLEDDAALADYLQRFLAEHQLPYPLPLYDRRGRYLFASPGKVDVLAKALLRAVAKGRDNELFVLLIDLLELADRLEPLVRAMKVTLARHHHVLLICPWPPGIATPRERTRGQGSRVEGQKELKLTADPWPLTPGFAARREFVRQTTTTRLHQAYRQVRQTFARMGVPVVCAASGDPVRLILDRLDRLRALGLGEWR